MTVLARVFLIEKKISNSGSNRVFTIVSLTKGSKAFHKAGIATHLRLLQFLTAVGKKGNTPDRCNHSKTLHHQGD
jgi:hypothetical protein